MYICIELLAHLIITHLYKLIIVYIYKSLFKHQFLSFLRNENSYLSRLNFNNGCLEIYNYI